MSYRSIKFRLVAWHAGLLTVIFMVLCAGLYFSLRLFLENDLRQIQLRRDRQIADALVIPAKLNDQQIAAQIKDWYEPEINDRFIRITRDDSNLIYVSGAPKDLSFDPEEISILKLPQPSTEWFSKKFEFNGNHTLLVTALRVKSMAGVPYLIEFGAPLDPVETMLNHLFLQLLLGLPLAVAIITAGGWVLVRRALKPVEQIIQAAESITQHNLSERLPVAHTGDELERLSISLNLMIARLDEAFQNSKRFVADASHELRTPLTILRGELENFAEDKRLPVDLRERAGGLLEECVHLSKIVDQLFTISRLDAGEAQAEWSRFDLAELARTTTEQMALLAEDKAISVTCTASRSITMEGDRVRLKQVIVNLLDNAIKYTPANGSIQLRVLSESGNAILEVEDTGIGIPHDSLPHVFDRFYRVDPARSAESGGAGLGLSIVKSICTAHGGQVEVTSIPTHGSCFRLKLPLPKTKELP